MIRVTYKWIVHELLYTNRVHRVFLSSDVWVIILRLTFRDYKAKILTLNSLTHILFSLLLLVLFCLYIRMYFFWLCMYMWIDDFCCRHFLIHICILCMLFPPLAGYFDWFYWTFIDLHIFVDFFCVFDLSAFQLLLWNWYFFLFDFIYCAVLYIFFAWLI